MDPSWLGGTWRPWIWEWEVSVVHKGQVVLLVIREERCRAVVVVVLIMKRRTWGVVERLRAY